MKHATSMALHAYWLSCHGTLGVPAGNVRAVELAPILQALFLIDLDLTAGFRFRFCGVEMAKRFGRDLGDEPFLPLWDAADREILQRHIRLVATRSTGLVAGVLAETLGGGYTAFEMLILPLLGATGSAGAIGSMVRIGGHEDANRIRARLVSQTLQSVRFLPQVGRAAAPLPFARTMLPATRPSAARRRYQHLSVVTGGK